MHILTINSGSSSIKFSIYDVEKTFEKRLAAGAVNGIGLTEGDFHVKTDKEALHKKCGRLPDHGSAMDVIFNWLKGSDFTGSLEGVGHRVVHGGTRFKSPHVINDELLAELRSLMPLAPNHLPHEIMAVEYAGRLIKARQVACFDTAFHRNMPPEAQTYPLPENLRNDGIIRYGFHGLSYEYILRELARGGTSGNGRVIIAHLGHGASMAAVKDGVCVDTTMGFTPAGGLVMSTRTGDLDPGVVIYLLMQKGMTIEEVGELVYKKSGLLGVSGISSDMKELLEKAKDVFAAKEAIAVFCYQAKKFIGAFTAVLGGLDTLVFTGGIGENAPEVRSLICRELACIGIEIDPALNDKNGPVISMPGGGVTVRVIKTDEELMVARHTYSTLTGC